MGGNCTAEATAAILSAGPLPCAGPLRVGPAGACGWQLAVAVGPSEPAVPGPPVAVPAEPLTPPGEVPVPLPSGEPPPSMLSPPDPCPPVSTVELTWTIAWRNGVTASAMLAMNATPASTTSGRTQPAPVSCLGLDMGPSAASGAVAGTPPGGCGSHRSRGQERELSQASAVGQRSEAGQRAEAAHCSEAGQRTETGHCSEAGQRTEAGHCSEAGHCRVPGHCSEAGHCTEAGRCSEAGHAQCPLQTQYLARSNAPLTTLSSHG